MTAADAHRIVNELRILCDPRGHELLDALEEYLVNTGEILAVIEGHRVLDDTPHSRRAGLRAVQ